jgi:copper(I)-binding protein
VKLFLRATLQSVLLLTAIGLLGCDSDSETLDESKPPLTANVSGNAAGLVTVEKAWIRATAPLQTVSGAFMTLVNVSASDYALVSVSFSGASAVEIHETSMVDGRMRMREVDHIDIPANGSAELKPGSYHIMLIGLERAMKAGATEALTLTFSDGSQKTVEALVGTSGE